MRIKKGTPCLAIVLLLSAAAGGSALAETQRYYNVETGTCQQQSILTLPTYDAYASAGWTLSPSSSAAWAESVQTVVYTPGSAQAVSTCPTVTIQTGAAPVTSSGASVNIGQLNWQSVAQTGGIIDTPGVALNDPIGCPTVSQPTVQQPSAPSKSVTSSKPVTPSKLVTSSKPVTSSTPAPSTTNVAADVLAMEQQSLALLNQERVNNGLAPLPMDPELQEIARAKSEDMAENNYFSHLSPTYGTLSEMLTSAGYEYNGAAENIAHHASIEKANAALMSSEGHARNILGKQWTVAGVGVAKDSSGYPYITQLFAR